MQNNQKQIWFPAKKYGWGWGPPCTWQGWIVFAVWLVLLVLGGVLLMPTKHISLFITYAVLLGIALFVVCLIKGETPRWRWGESKSEPTQSTAARLADLDDLRRRKLISETEYTAKREEILKKL
jgi:hypothetical protein